MIDQNIIEISCGEHRIGIQPGLGGSVSYWRAGTHDILRATTAQASQNGIIFDAAAFPLVPFSNRVAGSVFQWDGQQIKLSENHPASAHAIHGTGFQSPWSVVEAGRNSAAIKLEYDNPQHWPWPFVAVQRFTLENGCLHWTITLENKGDSAMPAGLGFHPYFAGQNAELGFSAQRVWITGEDAIPITARQLFDDYSFTERKMIAGHAIDNCYDGWNGTAEIFWPDRGKKLVISANSDVAILYVPQNEDYFCFEPVNHVNNALNCKDEDVIMPSLEPGETAALSVKLQYL